MNKGLQVCQAFKKEQTNNIRLIDGTHKVSANIKQNECLVLVSLFQSIRLLIFSVSYHEVTLFLALPLLPFNTSNKLVTCIDPPISIP